MKKTGRRWGHSGVPLGGIGAGKIELCPNGRFSNVATTNNWDAPICNGIPLLVPDRSPSGIPGSFLAAWVKGQGGRVLKTDPEMGMKGITKSQIEYDGFLPKCMMKFKCFKGIDLRLRAYGSLRLDNQSFEHHKDSSLPSALFQFEVKNTGRSKKDVAVAFSWRSNVGQGGYCSGTVSDTRENYSEYREGDGCTGLHFYSKRKKMDPRVEGTYSLITPKDTGNKITWLAGKQFRNASPYAFQEFEKEGTLPGDVQKEIDGALAMKFSLKPGEEKKIIFILSWWFPRLIATSDSDIDYGHAYENWFKDSWEVAEYMLKNRPQIVDGYHDWHHALMKSKMPDWLRIKLVNDLFPLITNSWYTKDYRFTINEAPTDMGGCAGTIDQRAASQSIYAMCFPDLNKAELKLWAEQQITAEHPKRYGKHWNLKTGDFDLDLDRKGAIRHDVGWDDLEGGSIDRGKSWQNLHWPDTQTVYVLQCYGHYIWTGDRDWFDYIYPKLKETLEFEERLDQNGDGIADIWGTGSNTYDGDNFPWFGASPFISTLHLAALKAGEKMALWKKDVAFAEKCRTRFEKIQKTMESVLWSKKLGYYISWFDETYKNWRNGERPHNLKSDACMNAQLAGQWFANLYDLGDILPCERIESAISEMTNRNLRCVPYSMANECYPDGKHTPSWPYYSETYYGCNAIYENEPDGGLECFEQIYRLMHEVEGSPWDTVLYYTGKDNSEPLWGNFYMTNPASWFILPAIGGFAMNIPDARLTVAPNVPRKINRQGRLGNWPIFMPQFWAVIDHVPDKKGCTTSFRITKWHGGKPLDFNNLSTKIPRGKNVKEVMFRVSFNGNIITESKCNVCTGTRRINISAPVRFSSTEDVLKFRVDY